MCFYSRLTKKAQALINRYNARIVRELELELEHPNEFNGFAFPATPVITNQDPQLILPLEWGLIPSWANDDSIKKSTLNARIETLDEKPAFRDVVKNRCLVLSDGFYEWQWLDSKGKRKRKYLITRPNDELYSYAGLWSEWINKKTGEIVKSYTIVTTEADSLMSKIHNSKKRMPIILTSKNEERWLNGQTVIDFAHPDVELIAKPTP